MLPYPDECLRGIANKGQLVEDGFVSTDVFMFQEDKVKEGGQLAQSINWNDQGAEEFTLSQPRDDGTLQFRGGIAVISRNQLDNVMGMHRFAGAFSYERDRIEATGSKPENPYHGNLLLIQGMSKTARKHLAAILATLVTRIIPPLNNNPPQENQS